MRIRFHILFFIAIGFLLLASISMVPNIGRKQVLAADGTEVRRPDGTVLTKPDTEGYIRKNWCGFTAAVFSMLFFVGAIARLVWNLWLRLLAVREGEVKDRAAGGP